LADALATIANAQAEVCRLEESSSVGCVSCAHARILPASRTPLDNVTSEPPARRRDRHRLELLFRGGRGGKGADLRRTSFNLTCARHRAGNAPGTARVCGEHSPPLIHGNSRMRKRACRDLCGGRSVMVVPTATVTDITSCVPTIQKLSLRGSIVDEPGATEKRWKLPVYLHDAHSIGQC